MSREDKDRIFIHIGCYLVRTFVLANRNQDLATVLLTRQYLTAPFSRFFLVMAPLRVICLMIGSAAIYVEVNSSNRLRVSVSSGQYRITCSKFSDILSSLQEFNRQKPPLLLDQNLHNLSVL